MADAEIVVQALGRLSFFGQIHDATTGNLGHASLFDKAKVAAVTASTPRRRTEAEVKMVRSAKGRTHLLNVSASLSASINFLDTDEKVRLGVDLVSEFLAIWHNG
ncbi:hypothetical protein RJ55_08494 [Drechmeria coniospora]|nr:hypothetical protein RJ55_08494 [Drechmeria coniospora]